MSNLLISEPPLQVVPSLAEEVGLNEAIVLQQVHYWLQRSRHKEPDEHGTTRRWVYKTLSEWEEEFPFWSRSTVKRTLRSLVDSGYVVAEKKRKDEGDTTIWYSIEYGALPDVSDCTTGVGQNDQTGRSDCTNGVGQNDQTRGAHNAGARSETTTTETTTENSGSSSGAPARKDTAGDSVPAPSDVDVSVSLDWLPEEYQVYASEVRALMGRYDLEGADQLVRRVWGNNRFSFHAVVDLARRYEWPRFVAGVVITGNEADTPNARYLQSLLDGFDEPNNRTASNEHGRVDPKQRPADNHERIAAAVASASGE